MPTQGSKGKDVRTSTRRASAQRTTTNQGLSIEVVHETNELHSKHHRPGNTILLTASLRKSHETMSIAFHHLHVSNILLLENLLDLSDYWFHHHLRKASLQKVKQKRELVHSFYRTDDVSWQALGKKDCIIICSSRGRREDQANSASPLHDNVIARSLE